MALHCFLHFTNVRKSGNHVVYKKSASAYDFDMTQAIQTKQLDKNKKNLVAKYRCCTAIELS